MHYLVTGVAGFIGFHLAQKLLDQGHSIVGVDNLNSYYDPSLKEARLEKIQRYSNFQFVKANLEDAALIGRLFKQDRFDRVLHMAAQAGVRYSLQNPRSYAQSNLDGFLNILEACRGQGTPHLVYASSSSVYGGNRKVPFSEKDPVDHPVSLYAATKRANELMAHTYAHLFNLPCTGLRFFTVYGPWGRPDMAYFQFTKSILEEKPIDVFNQGQMRRDFTYIDDVVQAIVGVADHIPVGISKPEVVGIAGEETDEAFTPDTSWAPHRIFNIGNNQPVQLLYFIEVLEKLLVKKAKQNLRPMQPGDVIETYADITALEHAIGFGPTTPIELGLERFVRWYLDFYGKG